MPRIGSPVGGIFDSRSDATAGHRLVIEARDDMQVGSHEKQKFPCRRPLLGGQVERGSPVNFRDDAAAAWNYVGRITRVSGRGVDAEVVLEVQVRLAQPVVIAKDTAFGHRTVLLADRGLVRSRAAT